jgi:hypothetical protein
MACDGKTFDGSGSYKEKVERLEEKVIDQTLATPACGPGQGTYISVVTTTFLFFFFIFSPGKPSSLIDGCVISKRLSALI